MPELLPMLTSPASTSVLIALPPATSDGCPSLGLGRLPGRNLLSGVSGSSRGHIAPPVWLLPRSRSSAMMGLLWTTVCFLWLLPGGGMPHHT